VLILVDEYAFDQFLGAADGRHCCNEPAIAIRSLYDVTTGEVFDFELGLFENPIDAVYGAWVRDNAVWAIHEDTGGIVQ
jgi:hypothetical protein